MSPLNRQSTRVTKMSSQWYQESYRRQERDEETAPPTQQLRQRAVPRTVDSLSVALTGVVKTPEMLFSRLEQRECAPGKVPGKAPGVAAVRSTC